MPTISSRSHDPTPARRRSTRITRLTMLLVAAAIALTACGSDGSVPLVEQAGAVPAVESSGDASPSSAGPEPVVVAATIGDSTLGPIIAGSNGLTLYGFTNDVDAASTCYGTCADAWPPVLVDADFALAPGLDVGIFATTVRDDGAHQLVAGKWPLYFFAGDANPGDLAGQGSGDVWFAVGLDGKLLTADGGGVAEAVEAVEAVQGDEAEGAPVAAAPIGTTETPLGAILVDAEGLSLYGFTNDADGLPTCDDACADAWPPVLVDSPAVPEGLDPEIFSVVERNDGTLQLRAGAWPLYRFAGDAAPGDTAGQGSGGVWFLADPAGGLITDDGADAAGDY